MRTYLYYLTDPRADEARYVGWTIIPARREREHAQPAARDQSHRARWVRALAREGCTPRLVVKAVLRDPTEAKAAEVRAIAALRARGYRLVNGTAGGDGLSPESWTAELRERLARSRMSPASRAGQRSRRAKSMGFLGAHHSQETRTHLASVGIGNRNACGPHRQGRETGARSVSQRARRDRERLSRAVA